MYAFDYVRPGSVSEALSRHLGSEDATYLAGGQTLIPTLKQRLRRPTVVIDLRALEELRGISVASDVVTIGAMTRHAEVAGCAELAATLPALAKLAGHIGDPQVRNCGTLGGSIANNDPAADYPAAVAGLAATVHTCRRAVGADAFFTGLFETSLEPGEIILKVSFRVPRRAAYLKFHNPASRYAVVGVMVAEFSDGVRVAVTGAKSCVFRATAMEQTLSQSFLPTALEGIAIPEADLNDDLHASARFRAQLIRVLARRAVASIT